MSETGLHTYYAIDPGTTHSGFVVWSHGIIVGSGITSNEDLLAKLPGTNHTYMPIVCEWIESYGMAVGKSVFETCAWIGRFEQAVGIDNARRMTRRDVKLHLCGSPRAKDANIRQALLDKFPATGGGANPQVGTKKEPGPLYGIKSHMWSALAIAVTWWETKEGKHINAANAAGSEA